MKPVTLDGLLYVLIATFGFIEVYFSNDDAYKYADATTLFWLKALVGTAAAAVSALKMYRSTSYSDHLKNQADAINNKQQAVQPITINEKTNTLVN